ncbi:hypothetical protein Gorai_009051 [Gossypium raimondii]|uniref:DUF4283 domain-containing protein n=1 Tax=Gossypium raimondii TaxID=29730 RepID=A0A7J8PRZ6_GOSRA|nr:hypothetical protein [Gossypium raimondii]
MKKTYCTFVNKMIYLEFNDGANRGKLPCFLFKFEFVLFSSFAAVKAPTHFLVFFNCLNAMLELEKQGWGDLLHVFERFEKWLEDWRSNSKIAWLSYYEMPFHAWCILTFSKFASLTQGVLESSSKEEMDSRPNCSASSQKEEFSECSRKLNLQEEESTNLEMEDDDVEIATTESKVYLCSLVLRCYVLMAL